MLPDDPDLQARLFYLVLLGGAVSVWAFSHYRGRMGQAAQHAAIWALIFIGAILAVGFFEPLKQQLFSDAPRAESDGSISFGRARDGHFYATAEVNGQDVRFLIDTGASAMVLARHDAERAGIDTDALTYALPVSTANGRVMTAVVDIDRVELAGITDHGVRAMVSGGELGQSLLGMDYLNRFSGFRVEGDRLYLMR